MGCNHNNEQNPHHQLRMMNKLYNRPGRITGGMLFKLPIMLLSNPPKFSLLAMPQLYSIVPNFAP